MKFAREADEAMHIDMTPMVDAIFAIILFLLVTSATVEALEQDISINLPTQGKAVKVVQPPAPPVIVNVRYKPGGGADFHINNNFMTVHAIPQVLSKMKATGVANEVVIRGDKNVKWDQIAAVMSAAAQAGITKVSATVEVKEDTGP